MSPTYHDKQTLILNKSKEIKNNQIVVFKSPESWNKDEKNFIKRILASPGDSVSISNNYLFVNDEKVTEISEKKCGLEENQNLIIDDNHYLVVGDNHFDSNDSLTQFCKGNEEFLVNKDNILITGSEFKVLGGK